MLKVRCQNRRQSPVIARGPVMGWAERLVGDDVGRGGRRSGEGLDAHRLRVRPVAVHPGDGGLHRQVDEPAQGARAGDDE